jgi:uncharacterized RDD family membrane protein YckC
VTGAVTYWIMIMSEYPPPPHPYGQPPAYQHGQFGQSGPALGGPPQGALASQGTRLAARLLDMVIILAALGVVIGIISVLQLLWQNTGYLMVTAVLGMLCGVAVLCSEPILTWRYGATLGKRALGLRVARLDNGQRLTPGGAFGRWISSTVMGFIPFLGLLNVLWCCWDTPYRQCLHDKAAGSVVVRTR